MDQLIPIINKLQDVFATVKSQPIDLPQIAVVGSQSVGKSSVLENIVGRDFLPRGTDIVTRRPLILQLINTKSSRDIVSITSSSVNTTDNQNSFKDRSGSKDFDSESKLSSFDDNTNNNNNKTGSNGNTNNDDLDDSDREWGEFLHKKGTRFYDFAEIRKEIEAETERVAPSKAVSPEPINLKIFSPRVLNLTLVDLPGMTKVPVANQPQDIGNRINKLIRAFISRPKCLILAVSAATSDLATSDGMQMALQIDPKGVRTLGVITKLDLMDQGTDAMDVLMGKVIPLQLGYVGVINRSQQNIYDKVNITAALKNEERFFKNHPVYRNIAHCCGIPYLAKKLNQILINHIKASLPDLKQQINNSIMELQTELMSYGEPLSAKEKNKGALLLQLISKFSDNFGSAIDGSGVMMLSRQNPASMSEASLRRPLSDKGLTSAAARDLFGGARILYIFRTEFQQNLSSIKPFDGLSDNLILNNMRNASGIRSSLFIPEMCFENLVKIQIEKLRHPCVNCVEMVYEELKRIASQCQTTDITRFSKFRNALNECVIEMLKRHLDPCRTFVHQLIDIELAYINTNHPDFISMDDVFNELRTNPRQSTSSSTQPPNEQQPPNPTSQAAARPSQQLTNPSGSGAVASNAPSNPNTTANAAAANKAKNEKKDKKPAEQGMFGLWGRSTNEPVVEDGKEKEKENKHYHSSSELQSANPFEQASIDQNMHSLSSMNMSNNAYLNGSASSKHITTREQLELSVIKRFIKSYFEIVKKNVSDTVPKAIMLMLINLSKERLQQDLALTLYREEKFEELLSENPEIAQKRKQTNDLLSVLRKSLDIVNEVRDHKSITNFE